MTRKVIAVLLNLITLIGGHFVNRRWDRAVFILGLFIVWGGYCYGKLTMTFGVIDSDSITRPLESSWQLYINGFAVIWILSLVLTIYDIRQPLGEVTAGISGYIGATVLSLLMMFTALATTFSVWVESNDGVIWSSSEVGTAISSRDFNSSFFHEYYNFGGGSGNPSTYPTLPEGSAKINGMISYNGQPVEGMTLHLSLNGKYRTEELVTGKDGRFSVFVPEGTWSVNTVELSSWPDKPEGSFHVLGGNEPRLSGDKYDEHALWRQGGLETVASIDNNELGLNFELVPTLDLAWPPKNELHGIEKSKTNAKVKEDIIRWGPYAGATKYVVKLSRIEREGSSTSYYPIGDYIVTENELPLVTLKAAPHSDENKEYGVDVFAFDEQGKLLTRTDRGYGRRSFVLADGNEIVSKSLLARLGSEFSLREFEKLRENKKRIDAAKVLIDEDMLDEAGVLLNKIEGASRSGQKELAQGYLAAKRGDCKSANALFATARSQAGNSCVPKRYQELCK